MVKQVDTMGLKPIDPKGSCRFESGYSHHSPGGEMVDTLALGASAKSVGVRVPPRAPILFKEIYAT